MWNFTLYSQTTGMVLPFYERPTLPSSKGFPYLPASKLKKVGKTTRSFRYDLSQIPCNYIVEVRNTFEGLDLIQHLMKYGWRFVTLYRRQGARPSPRKGNAKRQNGCLRRPYKQLRKEEKRKQRRKGKIFPSECRVPKNSQER